MNFQIYPLTVRINGQINGFGCKLGIVETFGCTVEYVETFGGRVELTLFIIFIDCFLLKSHVSLVGWVGFKTLG